MSVKRHTSTLMSSINVSDAMDIHEDNIDLGLLLYIILMAVTLTFSILSNALVIYCVARFKKLRTVTNILICNLSVSDILLAGFVMPQRLHDITHPGMDFYEGTCFYLYSFRLYHRFVFARFGFLWKYRCLIYS